MGMPDLLMGAAAKKNPTNAIVPALTGGGLVPSILWMLLNREKSDSTQPQPAPNVNREAMGPAPQQPFGPPPVNPDVLKILQQLMMRGRQ